MARQSEYVAMKGRPAIPERTSYFRSRVKELKRVSEIYGPAKLDDFGNYDEYWARRGHLNRTHSRWRIAMELIPDGSSVLDVGCGSGQFLDLLRTYRPNCTVSGIDGSERAVKMTRELGINATRLDIAVESVARRFDYVTCLEVIEHIPDAEIVLGRMVAAARRNVIISIPNIGFIGCRLRLALFGRFPITLCVFHMREHVRFWTVTDFREWTSRYGCKVVAQYPQHGVWLLWRFMPKMFASGMVYVVEGSVALRS